MMQRSITRTIGGIRRVSSAYNHQNNTIYLARRERPLSSSANNDDATVQSAFEILGLPERFTIDQDEMKKKYRKLMTEYHPDRNRQSTSDAQDEMQDKSSAVTQAYEELASPHTRAAHMMALRGKPMTETLSQSIVGMEFLMEIMEIREHVDSVAAGSDDTLHDLLQKNEQRINETCNEFEEALERDDLDCALKLTARLQYWNRVGETIREKIDYLA